MLLVEQNVPLTLEASRRVYFIEKGEVRHHAMAAELRVDDAVIHSTWGCEMDIPLDQILIQTVNGIVTGMILALVASGLTLIFGIMDVVNFAHGEFFMLGAYVGVMMLALTGSFWLALVAASLLIALFGAAIYLVTLRPLIGRDPLTTILATFGMSLVLQNYALWQFGPVARKIQSRSPAISTSSICEYPGTGWSSPVLAARDHRRLLAVPEIRHLRASGFAPRRRTA